LQKFNRPLICTEYMARSVGSTFDTVLPLAKKYKVGAINWGFVAGKTQTCSGVTCSATCQNPNQLRSACAVGLRPIQHFVKPHGGTDPRYTGAAKNPTRCTSASYRRQTPINCSNLYFFASGSTVSNVLPTLRAMYSVQINGRLNFCKEYHFLLKVFRPLVVMEN